jgi:hypothetical protein
VKITNPRISMPYVGMDEAGASTREWAHFKFNGQVDLRRIKREVRKYVKRNLGRHVHTSELRMVVNTRRITREEDHH